MSSPGTSAVQRQRHTEPQLAILSKAMTSVLPTLIGLRKNPKTVVKMIYDAAGIPVQERLNVNQWLNPRTTIGELYRNHASLHPSMLTTAVQQLADTPQTTSIPFVLQNPMPTQTTSATAATSKPVPGTNLSDESDWFEDDDDTQTTVVTPTLPGAKKQPRVVWSSTERTQVAERFVALARVHLTMPTKGLMLEAQKVLPAERQRDKPDFRTIEGEVRLLENMAASTATPISATPVVEEQSAASETISLHKMHASILDLTETVKAMVEQNKALTEQVETLTAKLTVDTTSLLYDAEDAQAHFCVLCEESFIERVRALFSREEDISYTISSDPKKLAERVKALADSPQEVFILESITKWPLPFELKIMKPQSCKNFAELKTDIQNAFDADF